MQRTDRRMNRHNLIEWAIDAAGDKNMDMTVMRFIGAGKTIFHLGFIVPILETWNQDQ